MTDKTLEFVSISQIDEAPENYRGDFVSTTSFRELVKSIESQGILSPILLRKVGKKYEVVAGSRRFKAAMQLNHTEVPAYIVEMTAEAALEARIVENVQREDAHPLEEANAFKMLAEVSKFDVKEIALRVGKSEQYVRQRLGLTNLIPEARQAFQKGKIKLGSAVLISKVEPDQLQKHILKKAIEWGMSGDSLRNHISDEVYKHHVARPWAKDEKFAAILGDEKRATLFDRDTDGMEDPAEHARKMAAFIEMTIRDYEAKGKKIVKICTSYGQSDHKGVLNKDEYVLLESAKARKEAKEDIFGIIVEGWNDKGKVVHISTDKADIKNGTGGGQYSAAHKLTQEEKEARKKEREKAKKEVEDHRDRIERIVQYVEGSAAAKDAKFAQMLVNVVLEKTYYGDALSREVAKRRGYEPIVDTKHGYTSRDFVKPIKDEMKKMSLEQKFALAIEFLITTGYNDVEIVKKAAKALGI